MYIAPLQMRKPSFASSSSSFLRCIQGKRIFVTVPQMLTASLLHFCLPKKNHHNFNLCFSAFSSTGIPFPDRAMLAAKEKNQRTPLSSPFRSSNLHQRERGGTLSKPPSSKGNSRRVVQTQSWWSSFALAGGGGREICRKRPSPHSSSLVWTD